jgi:hypothetical protein
MWHHLVSRLIRQRDKVLPSFLFVCVIAAEQQRKHCAELDLAVYFFAYRTIHNARVPRFHSVPPFVEETSMRSFIEEDRQDNQC